MAKIGINLQKGTVDKTDDQLIVGIDLGTTNSLVAMIRDGHPEVLTDENGENKLMPSVLHFDPNGDVVVGKEAIPFLIKHPRRTIHSVKRLMGKSYQDISAVADLLSYRILESEEDELVKVEIDGRYYSPVELSANILSALKKRVEEMMAGLYGKLL